MARQEVSGHGRKLSPEEAELWARVAKTVAPLDRASAPASALHAAPARLPSRPAGSAKPAPPDHPLRQPTRISSPVRQLDAHGLDHSWDRKLSRGLAQPDFTLDLHGCTLDQAHMRLLHGLTQARAMGARLVLLVTGKPRPSEPGERGERRGAIRAKVIDWLAASEHALDIAAIRGANRRHGGLGALYIVLKRRR